MRKLVYAAAASIAFAQCILAPSVFALAPIQRDVAMRFGLTPEQAATLYGKIDAMKDQVEGLSRANGISSRTLLAIALELGARNPNLSAEQFTSLIEARARDAAQAQEKIGELDKIVTALDPGGERQRALATLQKARLAFNEGHLEDAEIAFGEVAALRTSELGGAQRAWLEAIDLQARSASLRGDTERATAIRLVKMDGLSQDHEAIEEEQWRTAIAIAGDWRDRGDISGDNEALVRSINYYRTLGLRHAPRQRSPLNWGLTQMGLGGALLILGRRESGTVRLEESVVASREAMLEMDLNSNSLAWAALQANIGSAYMAIGERESGTARLEESATYTRRALLETPRERMPQFWALMQNNLGVTLRLIGERQKGTARLEEALVPLEAALTVRTRDRVPLDWATTQYNLAAVQIRLAERERSIARVQQAIAASRAALLEITREKVPLVWAGTQHILGSALLILGEREDTPARYAEAITLFREALVVSTRDRDARQWAGIKFSLGSTLSQLGQGPGGEPQLEEAITHYRAALLEYSFERDPVTWAATEEKLGIALVRLGQLKSDAKYPEEAISAFRRVLRVHSLDHEPIRWARITLGLSAAQVLIEQRRAKPVELSGIRKQVLAARNVAVVEGEAVLVGTADKILAELMLLKARGK